MLWLLALLYLMGFAAAVYYRLNRLQTELKPLTIDGQTKSGLSLARIMQKNLFSPALQVQGRILCRSKTPTG